LIKSLHKVANVFLYCNSVIFIYISVI